MGEGAPLWTMGWWGSVRDPGLLATLNICFLKIRWLLLSRSRDGAGTVGGGESPEFRKLRSYDVVLASAVMEREHARDPVTYFAEGLWKDFTEL